MRFGTRVRPMVGRLGALGRLATATTAADRWRGGQRRVTHWVALTVARASRDPD